MSEKTKPEATGSQEELEAMYGMESVFSDDLTTAVAEDTQEFNGDENVYVTSLKHDKVVNNVYKSVVRFIKNPRNNKERVANIISKWMYFLPHPHNPESTLVVDCPSNFGKRDNIVSVARFYLTATKSASLVKLGKDNFTRKKYWFTLLQVIKDIQQPELESKIKVFRFANQIYSKIEDITKTDDATNQVGVNYSHPFTGRNFIINVEMEEFEDKVTLQKKTQTSYSKSKFSDKETIFVVPGVEESKRVAGQEYAKEVFKYMLDESPELENYMAKEWDEATEALVIEAVRNVIGDDNIFNEIHKRCYGQSYSFGAGNPSLDAGTGKGLEITDEHLMGESTTEEKAPEVVTPTVVAEPTTGSTGYAKEDELPDNLEDY